MKTATQKNAELTQLCDLIKDIDVAMLTTGEAGGALVSRPMSVLEMDANGALWFFTDVHSQKPEELGRVNLGFTDHGNATYVSVSGRGQLQTELEHVKRLWTPMAKPWFPEGPESPNLALLKIEPETAEFWDAPNSKMVRMFAMAVSVYAGKPVGFGEHDTLTRLAKH